MHRSFSKLDWFLNFDFIADIVENTTSQRYLVGNCKHTSTAHFQSSLKSNELTAEILQGRFLDVFFSMTCHSKVKLTALDKPCLVLAYCYFYWE